MNPTPDEMIDSAIEALQGLKGKCESASFDIRRNIVDDGYENDVHGRPWKKNKWDGNIWFKLHLKVRQPLS